MAQAQYRDGQPQEIYLSSSPTDISAYCKLAGGNMSVTSFAGRTRPSASITVHVWAKYNVQSTNEIRIYGW